MPSYKIFQNNRLVTTIPGVLAPKALNGVETTSASSVIVVASTTDVYAGMPIACPNIPVGAFVAAVISSTSLLLAASIFNRTTGVWSTSIANAAASATATGLLATAFGYHPFCIIEESFPLGTWRNEIRNSTVEIPTSTFITSGTVLLSGSAKLQAPGLVSSAVSSIDQATPAISTSTVTPTFDVKDDTCAATPLKRHNGEPWGIRLFVSTGGLVSHIPATPDWFAHYSAATP